MASMRVFGRYLLLQLPGLFAVGVALYFLAQWTELSAPAAAGLLGLWLLKDLALWPLTRRAYETGGSISGAGALVGARGTLDAALEPGGSGWVRVGAERWRAELAAESPALPAGAPIRVTAVRDLVLLIRGDS